MSAIVQFPSQLNRNDIARFMIGYESLFDRLLNYPQDEFTTFPPYNLVIQDENTYHLEMALSGYSRNNLKVYTENGNLIVEADKEKEDENIKYAYRGMSRRSFKWKRVLADDVHVKDAKFEDGLLTVTLHRIIPENRQRKDYL